MTEFARIPIDYWSDPLCIWAFVAQPKLKHILDAHAADVDIHYRIVPVFGSVPHRFSKGSWATVGPEGRRKATQDVAKRFGREDVDGSIWVNDPPPSSWSSGAAAKAAFALANQGDAPEDAGSRYLWKLREACFLENRNISKRSEQLAVAEQLDLPRDKFESMLNDGSALALLWEDFEDKENQRIQGSPTYVFDHGRAILYGNVAEGIIRSTVKELICGLAPEGSRC